MRSSNRRPSDLAERMMSPALPSPAETSSEFVVDPYHFAMVTVGPVIGEVDVRSARILIETDINADVAIKLYESVLENGVVIPSGDIVHPVKHQCRGGRPTIFKWGTLKPGTWYELKVSGATSQVHHSAFRTRPRYQPNQDFNFLTVSCNKAVEFTPRWDRDMRKELWEEVATRKYDLLCHVGDQVYGDSDLHKIKDSRKPATLKQIRDCKYIQAATYLESVPKDKRAEVWQSSETKHKIKELYRSIYRETWGNKYTRQTLANIPNLMILDDHEVRDDWGDQDSDRDSDTVPGVIGPLAYQVYREYQEQLHKDVDHVPTEAFHFHFYGEVAILFLDGRASKTFFYEEMTEEEKHDFEYFGKAQWSELRRVLQTDPDEMRHVKSLFVMTAIPVVLFSRGVTAAATPLMNDLKGMLSYPKFAKEQENFIEMLTRWKQGDICREVTMISGDVHFSAVTDIFEKESKNFLFKQIFTSAVNNLPVERLQLPFVKAGAKNYPGFISRFLLKKTHTSDINDPDHTAYSSCHSQWTRKNNFLEVHVSPRPDDEYPDHPQTHKIDCVVRSKSGTRFWNRPTEQRTNNFTFKSL